ncbi:MAG: amidohydrolase [Roseovarius sp.]
MTQTIYHNGLILTVDPYDSLAEAVLTEGGKIIATGRFTKLRAQAAADAALCNLNGRTMIPAFIDPHGHFPDSGYVGRFRADLAPPPVGDCGSLDQALARLAELAAHTPAGAWVMGSQFDPAGVPENRFPTRQELDQISTDHPVWVVHFTGHAGVGNTRALAARGVTPDTPDPAGGWIGRDPQTGDLTGLLKGMAAMGDLGDSEFQVTFADFRAAFLVATDEYHAHGVALAQNAWATEELLGYFLRLDAEGAAGMDCVVLPAGHLEPGLSAGQMDLPIPRVDGRITLGPRKLFGDGSYHIQTACITKPYFKPLNGDPGFRCPPSITTAGMVAKIAPLHRAGHQIHIHSNGDATSDILLDAIEMVLDADPREDHRHTLIHTQILREDQLDRMARLGVTASFFPAHIYYFGDFHTDVTFGPERVQDMCPTRWAADRGIRFTIHNDAQVTPTRPLHLMWCAVNRLSHTGRSLGTRQALTPREALRAHTIDAAWQVFMEHERGSIEAGKRADFAILSANPLDDPTGMHQITVEQTIVAGQTVYDKGAP